MHTRAFGGHLIRIFAEPVLSHADSAYPDNVAASLPPTISILEPDTSSDCMRAHKHTRTQNPTSPPPDRATRGRAERCWIVSMVVCARACSRTEAVAPGCLSSMVEMQPRGQNCQGQHAKKGPNGDADQAATVEAALYLVHEVSMACNRHLGVHFDAVCLSNGDREEAGDRSEI